MEDYTKMTAAELTMKLSYSIYAIGDNEDSPDFLYFKESIAAIKAELDARCAGFRIDKEMVRGKRLDTPTKGKRAVYEQVTKLYLAIEPVGHYEAEYDYEYSPYGDGDRVVQEIRFSNPVEFAHLVLYFTSKNGMV